MKLLNAIIILLLLACSKGGDKPTPPTPSVPVPVAATLLLPVNNEPCLLATVVDATRSSVPFSWNVSANTDSYEIKITDLSNNSVVTRTVNTNEHSEALATGRSYSWYVVSKSNKTATTATSPTWKFSLAATPVTNAAPYPAAIVQPEHGATILLNGAADVTVEIKWTGTDPDGAADIASYSVYLDKNNATTLVKQGVTGTSYTATLAAGTYFFKIVTIDKQGNDTPSGVYSFTVK